MQKLIYTHPPPSFRPFDKLFIPSQVTHIRLERSENQEERLFQWDSIPIFGVMHCENSEVQIAVFSKWNILRGWKLV